MREELYDKVSHAERTYSIPGRAGKHISRLHEELAVQVDPRPGDSTWAPDASAKSTCTLRAICGFDLQLVCAHVHG
uniref:Uncharacterized protein n=1 Tax=Aegilops tauschii subsp. strangulata TaxID=200361 RepID=A0A452ZZV5_AEGTS